MSVVIRVLHTYLSLSSFHRESHPIFGAHNSSYKIVPIDGQPRVS